jgi:hypothetical protein
VIRSSPPLVALAFALAGCGGDAGLAPPAATTPRFSIQAGGASALACDEHVNWAIDGPHFNPAPTLTFSDPIGALAGQCGNLSFDDRTRSVTVTFRPVVPEGEAPYRYIWRRGRWTSAVPADVVQDTVLVAPPGTQLTRTIAMPLRTSYDGLGAIILLTSNAQLVPNEGPFVDNSVPEYSALNLWVQHWRHIDAPILNSASVANARVTLQWTNKHLGRPIDSTAVFRNNSLIKLLSGSATSYTDSVSAPGNYTYALKHFTPTTVPSVSEGLEQPNSAQSNTLTAVVPSTSMSALIVGPDGLPALDDPGYLGTCSPVAAGGEPPTE